jgi:catechol 2,3-dioxygenase-like lactoylglutathione lyase family enzyme
LVREGGERERAPPPPPPPRVSSDRSVLARLGTPTALQPMEHVGIVVDDLPAATAFVGELERYEDSYRLCDVRGPEGIIIELAEQIG